MNTQDELAAGIEQLNLVLDVGIQTKLLTYLELLKKWNATYNLTAIRDPHQMLTHHVLDSLAVLPHLEATDWLDVGCGAGLPGLILAMAKPEWQVSLLDSNSKKTSFVRQAAIELKISNIAVYTERVESWRPNKRFSGIISRAFAETTEFIHRTQHLLSPDGRWVAMKGEPEKELQKLPETVEVEKIISLAVPGLNAARSLVILKEHK